MDSTINEKKRKELDQKIWDTLLPSIFIIAFLAFFAFIFLNKGDVWEIIQNVLEFFDISSAHVNKVQAVFYVLLYIVFFELFNFIPPELQKLMFGDVIFNGLFISNNAENISKFVGVQFTEFMTFIIQIIYVINIIVILLYYLCLKNDVEGTLTQLWASIIMIYVLFFWLFSFIINLTVDKKVFDSLIGLLITFIAVGLAAALIFWKVKDPSVFSLETDINLVKRILLLIPCIYAWVVDFIRDQMKITTSLSIVILSVNIFVITIYLLMRDINIFLPKMLLNKPIHLNKEEVIGDNKDLLLDTTNNIYKNAISFWVNINKVKDRDTDYNIIDLTDKYKVVYNEHYDEFKINISTINTKKVQEETQRLNPGDNVDEIPLVILSQKNIPLQKWNNFVINYDKGTLDVFMNNEMIISQPKIILREVLSKVIIGEDNGLTGGICNVRYFEKVLKKEDINRIYNKSKNNNPPVI